MKSTRLFLTRHGQTVTNTEGRFCGHSETDLTPKGEAQAQALGKRLAKVKLDAIYTSDFSRAIRTAGLVAGERALTPRADPDLRELHYGEWELEKGGDVARKWRTQYRLMRHEDPAWRPPGGETVAEVRARTRAAFDRIVAAHEGQRVLVVAHGTALNCLISTLLDMPESHVFRVEIANCGLTEVIVRQGRPYVLSMNDTAHLAGI
ncbi:MAG: histidine phosphatase family protein [Dehalococcoidia bacterium]